MALDTFFIDSPGPGKFAGLYVGSQGCEDLVMEINPPGVGLLNQPFEPGLAIPADKRLFVRGFSISSEASAFGYTVPASSVPASAAPAPAKAKPPTPQN